MKKILKSIIASLILAAMMTGCGKKTNNQTAEDLQNMAFEVSVLSEESFTGMVGNLYIHNDTVYIGTSEILYEDETVSDSNGDDEETYSKGPRAMIPHLYSINIDGTDCNEIALDLAEGQYFNDFDITPDGSLIYMLTSKDQDTDAYSVVLVKIGADGLEQSRQDVTKQLNMKTDTMIDGVRTDSQGNILVLSEDTLYIFNEDYELLGNVHSELGQIGRIAITGEGRIVCGESGMQGDEYVVQAHILDVDGKKWKEAYPLQREWLSGDKWLMDGCGDYDFYYKNESGIYGYQIADSKESKLMDYTVSNLYETDAAYMIPDGTRGFIGAAYDTEDEETFHLVQYSKADSSKPADQKTITVASPWVGDAVEQAAINFNKENTDYKIVLKDYSGQQEMNLDIIAGNIPDIIIISEGLAERYAASGLLEDLTPYLEKDAELTEEDFIPSVFEAMKIHDRLYCIAPSFELYSLAGREKMWEMELAGHLTSLILFLGKKAMIHGHLNPVIKWIYWARCSQLDGMILSIGKQAHAVLTARILEIFWNYVTNMVPFRKRMMIRKAFMNGSMREKYFFGKGWLMRMSF